MLVLQKCGWLLTFAVVFVCLGIGSAVAQTAPKFGIEIKGGATENALQIPIFTDGRRMHAFIPVNNSGEVSTIRVSPTFKDGKLFVDLYEITGDFAAAKTCEARLLLPSRLAAKKEIQMQLNENFVADGALGWSLQLSVIDGSRLALPKDKSGNTTQLIPLGEGCGCGVCSDGTRCCPSSGRCMGCSSCGIVCCEPSNP
jgi:hypothetical protein